MPLQTISQKCFRTSTSTFPATPHPPLERSSTPGKTTAAPNRDLLGLPRPDRSIPALRLPALPAAYRPPSWRVRTLAGSILGHQATLASPEIAPGCPALPSNCESPLILGSEEIHNLTVMLVSLAQFRG